MKNKTQNNIKAANNKKENANNFNKEEKIRKKYCLRQEKYIKNPCLQLKIKLK